MAVVAAVFWLIAHLDALGLQKRADMEYLVEVLHFDGIRLNRLLEEGDDYETRMVLVQALATQTALHVRLARMRGTDSLVIQNDARDLDRAREIIERRFPWFGRVQPWA
jgi:hypothetical protein